MTPVVDSATVKGIDDIKRPKSFTALDRFSLPQRRMLFHAHLVKRLWQVVTGEAILQGYVQHALKSSPAYNLPYRIANRN